MSPETSSNSDEESLGLLSLLSRHGRLLLGLGLAWFGLIVGGGIFLSQIEAREGLHVFGSKVWVKGKPAAFRVGLKDLRFNRFVEVSELAARFIDSDGEESEWQALTSPAGDFVQGALTAPSRAGSYRLELRGRGPERPADAEMEIEVGEGPVDYPWPEPAERDDPAIPDTGPLKLSITPVDQVMAGNLPSYIAVRATDQAGTPVEAAVSIAVERGQSALAFPESAHTNSRGLAFFPVHPIHRGFTVVLKSGESRAFRKLKDTATQFSLTLGRHRAEPGSTVQARIASLHQDGPIFVDTWIGDAWIETSSAMLREGQVDVQLSVPSYAEGLVWYQAYRRTYLPGAARAGAFVLVGWTASKLADELALRKLIDAADHGAAFGEDLELQYLLGRIERPEGDPPLLADSGATAKATVRKMKSLWQDRLVLVLLGSGVLMLIALACLLILNYREVSRRWAALGAEDIGTRRRYFLQSIYMFLVLCAFMAGVAKMLLTVRW